MLTIKFCFGKISLQPSHACSKQQKRIKQWVAKYLCSEYWKPLTNCKRSKTHKFSLIGKQVSSNLQRSPTMYKFDIGKPPWYAYITRICGFAGAKRTSGACLMMTLNRATHCPDCATAGNNWLAPAGPADTSTVSSVCVLH